MAIIKKADLVVLILDREDQLECPSVIAMAIEREVVRKCPNVRIKVVLKDPYYESWLVADLEALASQPKRFKITRADRERVEPNKADTAAALSLMKKMTQGGGYDKISDAEKICVRMDLDRALLHSRSLRHFLHVLGWPTLQAGCRMPPS